MALKSENKISADTLSDDLIKKRFHPIYFLIGDEDWYFDFICDEIIKHAVDKNTSSFNFDFLYGSEITPEKLNSIITSYPMMAQRRVVIVKDFEKCIKSESKNEILEKYFSDPLDTTLLVLCSDKVDGRKKIIQTIKNNSLVIECNSLYDNEIPTWIRKRVKQKGSSISEEATRLLQSNVGNKLREIDNAIDKLILIKEENSQIEEEHVEKIVGITRDFSPFELTNAIGEKNISKSFTITHHLFEQGKSAVEIIATIAIHFQKLLKLTSFIGEAKQKDEIARAIKVHPYFLSQYQSHLKKYSQREIEDALVALALADEKTKSVTDSDDERTIILLISAIVRGNN